MMNAPSVKFVAAMVAYITALSLMAITGGVLNSVSKEVDELIAVSDSVGNALNPLISIHETTQIEIKSVIARCHLHNVRGCGK